MTKHARGSLPAAVALAVLVLAGLMACTGQDSPQRVRSSPSASPGVAARPPALEITPERGAGGEPLSTEIGIRTDGEITEVELSAEDGDTVDGTMREDGTSWVPERPLAPSTGYSATVTATGAGGQTTTIETSFTTMAEPGSRTGTGLYLFDDNVYGVAMPVVVEFVQPIPADARAGVQRRMFVSTDPPQPGVWHWVEDGRQAFYRAPEFWTPGTRLDVRIALEGHPTGDGRYGDADRSATATIGDHTLLKVDNDGKKMSVFTDDDLVRTMPVSLGKPSTPSSYGTMVVMTKEEQTVFDTYDELGPAEGYRLDIDYALRLTWGGEFIHSAPWSVADQGVRNVSHGCINLSPSDAKWLFGEVKVGDPVVVTGTERALAPGNGWTAWDLSWQEFTEGSALPVPDDLGS